MCVHPHSQIYTYNRIRMHDIHMHSRTHNACSHAHEYMHAFRRVNIAPSIAMCAMCQKRSTFIGVDACHRHPKADVPGAMFLLGKGDAAHRHRFLSMLSIIGAIHGIGAILKAGCTAPRTGSRVKQTTKATRRAKYFSCLYVHPTKLCTS